MYYRFVLENQVVAATTPTTTKEPTPEAVSKSPPVTKKVSYTYIQL